MFYASDLACTVDFKTIGAENFGGRESVRNRVDQIFGKSAVQRQLILFRRPSKRGIKAPI